MNEELSEKYIQHIAKKYGLDDLPSATKHVDECIKKTSAILNVEYSEVYNTLFSEGDISACLLREGVCDQMTIDECIESCSCFYLEPYGCLPRKFPDADAINEDPDSYIKAHLGSTEDLRKMVQIAAYLYYNYDGGGLTDNSYDALEYHLKRRERIKGRAYEKIGAPPVEKIRTNLPYGMASLDKIKPGMSSTVQFLSQFDASAPEPIQCSWSHKLDGISGMAVYKNGVLTDLYTRGDGVIGGDVTYLKEYITKGLPRKLTDKTNLVVRGEFIISKEIWENKYQGSYSNARAFVSGKINSGFVSPALPDIEFVAYEIMRDGDAKKVPRPSQAFKILDAEGFNVVKNGLISEPTVFEIMELYKRERNISIYYIDGLVLSPDVERPAAVPASQGVANPTDTVAFKMLLEEQIRSTKVINVEWNISRYGRYVPVAIYEAVFVEGVRMTRATAHNARHIQDWSMGKGTKIKVVRSGDVIPQIKDVDVDGKISPIFPPSYEEGGYEWHWKSSDIILNEIETNREVLIKRIVHFFETIEVPRLRQKTAEKMYDAGMTTPESIANSTVTEMIKIKGIAEKTAKFFHTTIREVMSHTPPDRFIVASTTFKTGIGRKLLKQLFRYIPDILDLDQETITKRLTDDKIPGFGKSRIKNVSEGIPKFRQYLNGFTELDVERAISYYVERIKTIAEQGYNPLIKDKRFVLTGFMGRIDYELEDYIYDHRGDFTSTVTSDVEAVISGNIMEVSKKTVTAAELGVPVLTIQEFSERYNVPLARFETSEDEDEDD